MKVLKKRGRRKGPKEKYKDRKMESGDKSSKEGLNHYGVIIYYQEPFFCKTIGKDPKTVFTSLFRMRAENAEKAKDMAFDKFKRTARLSSVRWERKIIKSEVKLQIFLPEKSE